jgi:ferredoxin
MSLDSLNLSRRKFMIVSSAAIAAPIIMDAVLAPGAKGAETTGKTYYIGHQCIGCQVCRLKCPSSAINYGDDRNEIDQKICKHCGTCYRNCPISVITES